MEHTQTVTNVSIEWMLKNLSSFIDGYEMCACPDAKVSWCEKGTCAYEDYIPDWESMIKFKAGEVSDGFIDSIMSEGVRSPICITVLDDGKFMHGNGHHRTAIAILACLDVIPVIFSFNSRDYMVSHLTGEYESKSNYW